MYVYIMKRTQIYLDEELDRSLEALSKASGLTKSQLIREALAQVYLARRSRASTLRSLKASAGGWRRAESGEAYVERVRRGRLAKLHDADGS
jgi:predicted transcriptional regulator